MIFIIEHLEDEMHDWCVIEYRHISSVVGKDNLWFTNVTKGKEKLKDVGTVHEESVTTMMLDRACLLDPAGEQELSPDDNKEFNYVIFGGILGDNPPKGRTRILRETLSAQQRSLGTEQMSTNTAVLVTKRILDGQQLDEIEFQDGIEIMTGDGEEVELPYRYVIENGEPVLPPGLIEHLKRQEGF